jgi:hypothetical protein
MPWEISIFLLSFSLCIVPRTRLLGAHSVKPRQLIAERYASSSPSVLSFG